MHKNAGFPSDSFLKIANEFFTSRNADFVYKSCQSFFTLKPPLFVQKRQSLPLFKEKLDNINKNNSQITEKRTAAPCGLVEIKKKDIKNVLESWIPYVKNSKFKLQFGFL